MGGLKILPYLDYWLICAPTRRQVAQDTGRVITHIEALGFKVNMKKSNLEPRQHTTFVGLCLNSLTMSASLSPVNPVEMVLWPQSVCTLNKVRYQGMSPNLPSSYCLIEERNGKRVHLSWKKRRTMWIGHVAGSSCLLWHHSVFSTGEICLLCRSRPPVNARALSAVCKWIFSIDCKIMRGGRINTEKNKHI